jgi:type VI secretion system Hcp family effector
METQRGKIRMVIVVCVLATLSGLSLMAFAGGSGIYDRSLDPLGSAASDAILAPWTIQAAGYLKFDGIDGEAQDKDHKNWSDLTSFSQGHLVPAGEAPGRPRGRVVFEDIVVSKEIDKASPKLAEACAKGKVFPRVDIHWTRVVAGAGQTYYSYELRNVQVTSYSLGGSAQADPVPTETLSLNFEEIKATYTEYDETGRAKGKVEYTWKIEEGVK